MFLLCTGIGVDLLARHSHNRSERYRTGGFTFHHHLDIWECPEGQQLHRYETDHARRHVRYRAKARICNACPSKAACTDSDEGREIVRSLDSWPRSEVGRFHRGISVMLVFLAGLIAAVELVRHHQSSELLVTAPVLGLALVVGARLGADLLGVPSTVPEPRDSVSALSARSGRDCE